MDKKLINRHNPHNSLTPQRLFTAKTPFQLDSIFCLHSITVVHFRNQFISSTWNTLERREVLAMDKKQNKARTEHGENRWISWWKKAKYCQKWQGFVVNSQKTKQLVLISECISSQKEKIMESRRKQCYERATSKNKSRLFFVIRFFIVQNECLLAFLKLRCGTFSSVCFCFVEVRFFSFCFVLCWPRLKHVPP